jgi:hypothetical protein
LSRSSSVRLSVLSWRRDIGFVTVIFDGFAAKLRRVARPGCMIALGDGVGAPGVLDDGTSVCKTLSSIAREIGGISVILGWTPVVPDGLTPDAFARIITLMPGWGTRKLLPSPVTRSISTSMAAIPALLSGQLRPDLLITRMTERRGGVQICTAVSWQRALAAVDMPIWAVLDDTAACASAETPIPSRMGHSGGRHW